jgi:serine/threonine protein kinase
MKVVDIDELHKVYLDYDVSFKTVAKLIFNEIKILKMLHHPNIVCLHESFQVNHTIFMIMEYIDGCDLLSVIPVSGMSEGRAREFFLQLCSGVDYCHAHNVLCPPHHTHSPFPAAWHPSLTPSLSLQIVHGDLKLENILVRRSDSAVKIIDFGFAQIYEPGRKHVVTKEIHSLLLGEEFVDIYFLVGSPGIWRYADVLAAF